VLMYLAAAGVGRLGIVEMDRVDLSNLQRQVLFDTQAIGQPKAEVARARLASLNPHVHLETHTLKLDSHNALSLLEPYDLVLDCTDNFPTRYLVNDACVLLGKTLVYGAIHQFEGQLSVFHFRGGPCYRCLFPHPPKPGTVPSCSEAGVFGVLPGVIGGLMATEALKVLLGQGDVLSGKLLLYDGLHTHFHSIQFPQRPDCPVCGVSPSVTTLQDYELFCGISV
uniref:HesA/MoeB/ThiF family protein n=1 Tax=uncultured Meiothermus sp. TaxID=157471 RepID=UPI00262B19EC